MLRSACIRAAGKAAHIGRVAAPCYAQRAASTAAAQAPPASSLGEVAVSASLKGLAKQLCELSLVESAQLVALLRTALNLPDVVVAAAPAAGGAAAASAVAPPAEAPAAAEKTIFNVVLEKFEDGSKAKIIREIKTILPQMNLVEAKAFVEGAPKVVKEKVSKADAEQLKKTLEALGATVSLQ